MSRRIRILSVAVLLSFVASCSTGYQAQPLPFKAPASYSNAREVFGATVAAKAYVDSAEALDAFGYDIRSAGMLPVQVIFDNPGSHYLEIVPSQTFLEDRGGNLWPVLPSELAYERVGKFAQKQEIFRGAAEHGFLGALAGAVVGAAIGIVSGQDVAKFMGRGAAVGAAGGMVMGGAAGYESVGVRHAVIDDLKNKSLQTKPIPPGGLSFGVIFFPGEARSAHLLRLQVRDADTGSTHVVILPLS